MLGTNQPEGRLLPAPSGLIRCDGLKPLVLLFLPLEGPAMELDGCVGKVIERILLIHEVGPQTIEILFKDGTMLRLSLAQRVGIEVSLDDGKSGDRSVPKKYPTAA